MHFVTASVGVAFASGDSGAETLISNAIMQIARSFGLDIVGEGVENVAQAAYLRDSGCPEAQGFLFSRAVPAAEATKLLVASASAGGAFPEVAASLLSAEGGRFASPAR